LIWVGGLVTTLDAGMAVPDWPNTYGYNMFAYPWQTWLFGPFDLFIEHGHRLLASVVGMIAIVTTVVAFRSEPRPWVRYLAYGALGAVIFQGVLGGVRVLLDARTVAMIHGCFGPAFFAICVALAACTGKFWFDVQPDERLLAAARRSRRLTLWMVSAAFLQIVVGAQLRHVPPSASQSWFSHVVYTHLALACLVVGLGGHVAWRLRVPGQSGRWLRFPATCLGCLVLVQLALGVGSWVAKYGYPHFAQSWPGAAGFLSHAQGYSESIIVTGHAATGSLILAVATLLMIRVRRVLSVVHADDGLLSGGSMTRLQGSWS
jgi:cytochrome c oxidase assembly protein subunit 15